MCYSCSMPTEISETNYTKLALAAKGAGVTVDEMLERILDVWLSLGEAAKEQHATDGGQMTVYAIYQRTRVEALFDPSTGAITGTTAPIKGKQFSSPSGAARAVVEALNPEVSSNRNGLRFWHMTATDKELATTLR
jgi:hypothetical protein